MSVRLHSGQSGLLSDFGIGRRAAHGNLFIRSDRSVLSPHRRTLPTRQVRGHLDAGVAAHEEADNDEHRTGVEVLRPQPADQDQRQAEQAEGTLPDRRPVVAALHGVAGAVAGVVVAGGAGVGTGGTVNVGTGWGVGAVSPEPPFLICEQSRLANLVSTYSWK